MEEIHSKERLEILNKEAVERIKALMDNSNVESVNMLTVAVEEGRGRGLPIRKIENHRPVNKPTTNQAASIQVNCLDDIFEVNNNNYDGVFPIQDCSLDEQCAKIARF